MAEPNVQEVVNGVLIVVTLVKDKAEASFVLRHPKGSTSYPKHVDIDQYLKKGMSEQDALKEVLKIVKGVIESAAAAGLF
ncbi:hypothetical protein SAMN05444172_2619 [Burkholderia sp. GAS332]|nr:hypothetical protein SAMN05444172_2619 [Burkholderia sp. GAS332]